MKYENFLKWWLVFTLVVIGFVFSLISGLPQEIWNKDGSYLSAITFMIFVYYTIFCGNKIMSVESSKAPDQAVLDKAKHGEEVLWFISEACLNLGMLGTIIGFVMMLAGFEGINVTDQSSIQKLLSALGNSMATALYTTLVGLVCGQVIKLEAFILATAIDRAATKVADEKN